MTATASRSTRRRTARLLVGALAPDRRRRAARDDVRSRGLPAGLADAAGYHGVAGFVHRLAAEAGATGPEAAALADARTAAVGHHLRVVRDLRVVADALAASGVPWLAFKGPALAVLAYPTPDLRGYTDLDVVVAPGDFAAALDALEQRGGVVLDRNWTMLRETRAGQLHVRLPAGTLLDLHWSLVYEAADRDALALPTFPALSGHARTVPVSGVAVPTFGPVDTLLHVALHAARSGLDRLIWLEDVARAVVAEDHDWDAVVAGARGWRAGPAVALALDTAARILGAPVPSGVARALSPSRLWRWTGTVATAVAPPQRADGGGSVRRLVARSCRAGARASTAELARRSVAWLRRVGRPDGAGRWSDPTDPASPWYPSAGREAYLAAERGAAVS